MRRDLIFGTATALGILASSMAPMPALASDGLGEARQEEAASEATGQFAEADSATSPERSAEFDPVSVVVGAGIVTVAVGTGVGVARMRRGARRVNGSSSRPSDDPQADVCQLPTTDVVCLRLWR